MKYPFQNPTPNPTPYELWVCERCQEADWFRCHDGATVRYHYWCQVNPKVIVSRMRRATQRETEEAVRFGKVF